MGFHRYYRAIGIIVAICLIGVALFADNHGSSSVASGRDDGSQNSAALAADNVKSELAQALPTLEAFVEKTTGLKFLRPVDVTVLDPTNFDKKLNRSNQDSISDKAFEFRLHALSVLRPDQTLRNVMDQLDSSSALGFYDSDSKSLYVLGTNFDIQTETTLVQELTHAIQDQNFGLNEKSEFESDSHLAYTSVVEGQAAYVEKKYFASLSSNVRSSIDNHQQNSIDPDQPSIPTLIGDLTQFPFQTGENFVESLVDTRGNGAVDAAFKKPPLSTSQISNPAMYLQQTKIQNVAIPDSKGYKHLSDGILGEAFLESLTDLSASDPNSPQINVSGPSATSDASGWVGDHFVAYSTGDQACIAFHVEFDNFEDRDAFSDALAKWTQTQRDAEYSLVGQTGVASLSCSPQSVA